eukprot:12080-Chlamydomonas_euryale.AAC.2
MLLQQPLQQPLQQSQMYLHRPGSGRDDGTHVLGPALPHLPSQAQAQQVHCSATRLTGNEDKERDHERQPQNLHCTTWRMWD